MSKKRNYDKFWSSTTTEEKMDWVEYHFLKYRKMGYEVGTFRSLTSICDNDTGKPIVSHRSAYHELKAIDDMEEYLKNKKNLTFV
jgi:hypothetical protein